ncbi:MAG: AAA family ATPase [Magnetococcales bacterium]|nr:AAA family ATPase [Magnetococcales bacterium]
MENRPISSPDPPDLSESALQTLTIRQREILHLVQGGKSNREIADQLGISEGTVKQHLVAVFRHLNVRNRTMAAKMGLLSQQSTASENVSPAKWLRNEQTHYAEATHTLHFASAIQPITLVVARFWVTESMMHRLGSGLFGQLNRTLRHLCEQAAHHFAGLVQTIPGGLILLFGLPNIREEDAQRAACAACWIHRRMLLDPVFACLSEPIPLRICVISGEVVVSIDSGKTILHGTLLSHPCLVTPVACSNDSQPHLSSESKEIIRYHALRYGIPSAFFPEGEAVRAAVGLSGKNSFRQPDLLPAAPLFGRESEWQSLLNMAEQVRSGNGQSLVIVGEAGFGKTRLIQELRRHLDQQPEWLWLESQCRSMAGQISWYPLSTLLAQLSHCQPEWNQATQKAHMTHWLHTHYPSLAASGELLLEQLCHTDWQSPDATPQTQTAAQQQELVRLLTTLLRASNHPTVVVLDNLQWADAATLALFPQLAEACNGSKVWLIGVTRRSWLRLFPGSRIVSTLSLSRLSLRATHQLLRSLQPSLSGGDPLRRQMSQWSSGVPLFATELLQQASRYAVPEQQTLLDLFPHTLLGLILGRLDTVAVHWRVVRAIAAYGRIRLTHLYRLDIHPTPTVEAAVDYLVKIGLLAIAENDNEREISFNNEMVRSAIWLTLLEKDRIPEGNGPRTALSARMWQE